MKAISNNQTFFIYRSWSETTSHKNSPEFNSNNNKENIRMKIIIIIKMIINIYYKVIISTNYNLMNGTKMIY